MNKGLIILIVLLIVAIGIFGISTFYKQDNITSYVAVNDIKENVTKEIVTAVPVTGNVVKPIEEIVTISFANKKEQTLGYLPKTLILKDLVNGASVKLKDSEIMVGQIRGDMSVILAIFNKDSSSNIYLTDGIPANFNTLDGEIDLFYENKVIRIEKI